MVNRAGAFASRRLFCFWDTAALCVKGTGWSILDEAMKRTEFLMGTVVTIEARGAAPGPAVDAALREMARIEGLMSRFQATSDVGCINAACLTRS